MYIYNTYIHTAMYVYTKTIYDTSSANLINTRILLSDTKKYSIYVVIGRHGDARPTYCNYRFVNIFRCCTLYVNRHSIRVKRSTNRDPARYDRSLFS